MFNCCIAGDLHDIDCDDPRRLACHAASRQLGFLLHAGIYLIVNVLLAAIDLWHGGPTWPLFPLLAWGIGLLAHGLVSLGPLERLCRVLLAREPDRTDMAGRADKPGR